LGAKVCGAFMKWRSYNREITLREGHIIRPKIREGCLEEARISGYFTKKSVL